MSPLTMMTTSEKATQKSTTRPRLSVHHTSFLWALCQEHDPEREMFGFARLQVLVDEYGGDGGSLAERLLGELSGFVGTDAEQEDDITLIVLQRLSTTRRS